MARQPKRPDKVEARFPDSKYPPKQQKRRPK